MVVHSWQRGSELLRLGRVWACHVEERRKEGGTDCMWIIVHVLQTFLWSEKKHGHALDVGFCCCFGF
jgi:hypothetical protein